MGAADIVMPGVPDDGMQWMDDYDAYYYDRDRRHVVAGVTRSL